MLQTRQEFQTQHDALRQAELPGRGLEQLSRLEETLSNVLSSLKLVQWAPRFQLLGAITHAGVALGDATVFESFLLL